MGTMQASTYCHKNTRSGRAGTRATLISGCGAVPSKADGSGAASSPDLTSSKTASTTGSSMLRRSGSMSTAPAASGCRKAHR